MAMDYEDGDARGSDAKSRVLGPAIGLMILGILQLLWGLSFFAFGMVVWLSVTPQLREKTVEDSVRNAKLNNPGMTKQEETTYRDAVGLGVDYAGVIYAMIGVFPGIFGLVVLCGAISMLTMKSFGMAMTASIAALLPCSCCAILGMPFGIWGIVALNHPDVKLAFQRARGDRF